MDCYACECDGDKESETRCELDLRRCGLYFEQAGKSVQHPLKVAQRATNADRFAADGQIIGVADGVSSVEDEGVDPSKLPLELLSKCLKECKLRRENSHIFDAETVDRLICCDADVDPTSFPLFVLARAAAQCTTLGSTTCVLGILEDDRLWSANIGDSQLLLLRRTEVPPKAFPDPAEFDIGACYSSRSRVPNLEDFGGYGIVYRTTPQQHFFNCPYQFARMPDTDCSREGILRRITEAADVGSAQVQPGDVVIMGTDGLFDNIFDDDIIAIVNRMCWESSEPSKPPKTKPADVVDALLERALKAADPSSKEARALLSPFAKAAFDSLGRRVIGGKPDDTTVVVAYVASSEGSDDGAARASEAAHAMSNTTLKETVQLADPVQALMLITEIGGYRRNSNLSAHDLGCGEQCERTMHKETVLLPFKRSTSRSSFPPRSPGITNPATKASIHAVHLPLKAMEYSAFDRMRASASQRVQAAFSAAEMPAREVNKPNVFERLPGRGTANIIASSLRSLIGDG